MTILILVDRWENGVGFWDEVGRHNNWNTAMLQLSHFDHKHFVINVGNCVTVYVER